MRAIRLFLLGILLCISVCRTTEKQYENTLEKRCRIENFDNANNAGYFTGIIILWDKPSAIVSYGGLFMTDKGNDTIVFRVEPDEIIGFKEDSLEPGKCATIKYSIEIIEEDGIELNRFYHANSIVFP